MPKSFTRFCSLLGLQAAGGLHRSRFLILGAVRWMYTSIPKHIVLPRKLKQRQHMAVSLSERESGRHRTRDKLQVC